MDEIKPKCGVTRRIGRFEWICIKPVHATIYSRRRGGIAFENNPGVDKHYFVNRYPNRKEQS
jgi:hypothetical protein